MSKAKRNAKKELREQKQEEQAKKVLYGIAVAAIVLVLAMFIYYAQQG